MPKNDYVTETQDELFDKAERDIMSIDILCKDKMYPADRKYDIICFHATQAVEKFLKGYIIANGQRVKKIHNLAVLLEKTIMIDKAFKGITTECVLLNQYIAEIKYSNRNPISKSDIGKVLGALKTIGNFALIKSLRDLASKKQKYQIVTEITVANANPKKTVGSK